jgi:hypothetical protein
MEHPEPQLEALREPGVLDPVAPALAEVLGDRLGLSLGQELAWLTGGVGHDRDDR